MPQQIARISLRFAGSLLALAILAGCSGGAGNPAEPDTEGSPLRARLVTTEQYQNSLAYIFGPSVDVRVQFAPPQRTEGLVANGAANAGLSETQVEQFQRAASGVAEQVVDDNHREYLLPCQPADAKSADNDCASAFLSKVGRLLYRRTLHDEELARYVDVAGTAADRLEDFYEGVAMALEGMLINAEVLFVVERAESDPQNPDKMRLDAHSFASRLSYFLWNASPDDELLTMAETGLLDTYEGRTQAVDRLLASSRLEDGMRAFFADMLQFQGGSLSKDPTIYPQFTSVTAAAAREQTLRTMVDFLIERDNDYRDLFTSRTTFITPALAPLYDVAAAPGWTSYTFPEDSPRVGLLSQISFLAQHSHPGRSSPTLRGIGLREVFFCQEVPAPPPGVNFAEVINPAKGYPTQRDRVAVHVENPSCAGCHRIMDPPGLALENFDGSGRFRTTENGVAIDPSGQLDGVEFQDVSGLYQAVRNNEALPTCFANRLYSYGSGGPMENRSLLDFLVEAFSEDGYRVPELLRTIATSNAFSRVHLTGKEGSTVAQESLGQQHGALPQLAHN
ncbi:MAG: DUF1592 domain-containing protein [Woeseia sp.]